MRQHLVVLLVALALPSIIACARSERPPVELPPPAVSDASVAPAASTQPERISVSSLRGVDGEMVHLRPVTGRGLARHLERMDPVIVGGETAYFRMGAWITSPRAIGSKYTISKWDDEALALLVPYGEDDMWLELTVTLASGVPADRARLIETAESSPLLRSGS
jgi:predicted small lipoprotein YifL